MPERTDGRQTIPLRQYRLDNGLRVTVSPDPATPIAAVNLWYDVGSRFEAPGRHGFAHLFEHLMFEGSQHVGKAQHFALLQAVGGSNVNATTSFDRTNYFETMPVEELELALWLEADRMGSLELTQETLDNQREVVKNERRQRTDNPPYGDCFEQLQLLAFPDGHPYQHSVIGSMQHLGEARLEHFRAFYDTYYTPNNAVLTVVGDVDPDAVHELAQRYFGGLPAKPDIPAAPDATLPVGSAPHRRQVLVRAVPMARYWAAYHTPPLGTHEHDVLTVLSTVLGSGRGCPLYRELVQVRRLARPNGGFMGNWDLADSVSLFVGSATARAGVAIEQLESAYDDVVATTLAGGIDAAQLDRARAQLTSGWLGRISGVAGRADAISGLVTQFGDPELINTRLDRLLSVTADDLVDVGRAVLRSDARSVITYLPGTPEEAAA